jgi:hypothetical protein
MFREFIINTFRGGVHRWIFIYIVICLILIFPFYLLGQGASKLWYNTSYNSARFVNKEIIKKDYLTKNDNIIKFDEFGTSDLLGNQKLLYTFANNQTSRDFGYDPFVYKAQVLDGNGKILNELIEKTYILPGEASFISAYSEDPNATSLKIIQLPETNQIRYNPLANPLLRKVTLDVRDARIIDLDQSNLTLKASLKNVENIKIKKIDVVLIIRDGEDAIVGAKNFSFNNLGPQEERSIELIYPKPKDKNATNLDVRYSINFLDPESIKIP